MIDLFRCHEVGEVVVVDEKVVVVARKFMIMATMVMVVDIGRVYYLLFAGRGTSITRQTVLQRLDRLSVGRDD
jgi:hypothetical protein